MTFILRHCTQPKPTRHEGHEHHISLSNPSHAFFNGLLFFIRYRCIRFDFGEFQFLTPNICKSRPPQL